MDVKSRIPTRKNILDKLVDEGHSILPIQWIETDQNEHFKRPGKAHEINIKSRLAACGQFEKTAGIRVDSPTCPVEVLTIVCSFAACESKDSKQGPSQCNFFMRTISIDC